MTRIVLLSLLAGLTVGGLIALAHHGPQAAESLAKTWIDVDQEATEYPDWSAS